MKKSALLIALLPLFIGLSACRTEEKPSYDVDKYLAEQRQLNELNKSNKENQKALKDIQTQGNDALFRLSETLRKLREAEEIENAKGGQPGLIVLQGIVVDNDVTLDSRINIFSQSGIAADGTMPEVSDRYQPVLQRAEHLKPLDMNEYKKLAFFGCSKETVKRIARDRHITEFEDLSSPADKSLKTQVKEKIILLCGKYKENYSFINIEADELILNELDMDLQQGKIHMTSNKLTLLGQNRILMNASPSLYARTGDIFIGVLEALHSDEEGALSLISLGKNSGTDL